MLSKQSTKTLLCQAQHFKLQASSFYKRMDCIDDHIEYEHIRGNLNQQKDVTRIYMKLLEIRNKMLEERESSSLPGHTTGHEPLPGGAVEIQDGIVNIPNVSLL